MKNSKQWLKEYLGGLRQIIFPKVCVCCGEQVEAQKQQICRFCIQERFEEANPDNLLVSAEILLPEGVLAQHAMWKYYKGSNLQQLIHLLKYERMIILGINLGAALGRSLQKHRELGNLITAQSILLPVPLHPKKFRSRGFNQAHAIALGIQQIWKLPICDRETVVRTKRTYTQTGFSIQRRLENVKGAFEVTEPAAVVGKKVLIVDDVFTTGATTFELAQAVSLAGSESIIIVTVAQA